MSGFVDFLGALGIFAVILSLEIVARDALPSHEP